MNPDGSLDQKKYSAFHNNTAKDSNDPQSSVMSTFNSCKVTERQGWVLGIAAKKAIQNKHYQYDVIFHGTNTFCRL